MYILTFFCLLTINIFFITVNTIFGVCNVFYRYKTYILLNENNKNILKTC